VGEVSLYQKVIVLALRRLLQLEEALQRRASTAQSMDVLNVKSKAPVGTVGLVSRYSKENVPVQRRRLSLGQVRLLHVLTAL
jgi:hypothetical protein